MSICFATSDKLDAAILHCNSDTNYSELIHTPYVKYVCVSVCVCGCVCVRARVRMRAHAKSLQSCPILCDPMDCGLLDFSVHGIPQPRILEWVAMPFFRGSSRHRNQTKVSCLLQWQAVLHH